MKYILKGKGQIQCLQAEHNNHPSSSAQATQRWKRFSGVKKSELVNQLKKEQFYLCAYTELRPDELGLSTHVEHVKPKSKYPHLTFNYHNLVLDALSSLDMKTIKPDRFGGHFKGNHYDRKHFMSPLIARKKRSYFLYLSDGRVIASPNKTKRYKARVEHTIRALNLNSPYLVNLRKRWIEDLDENICNCIDNNQDLLSLAIVDLVPRNGKVSRFFSATRQRFGDLSEHALAKHASQLL